MKHALAILQVLALVTALAAASPSLAQANQGCGEKAEALARDLGGTVRRVVATQAQGRNVCEVSIAVPGQAGSPPRVVNRLINAD